MYGGGPGAFRRDHSHVAGDGSYGYGPPPHDPDMLGLMVEFWQGIWRLVKYPFVIIMFVVGLLCAGNGVAAVPMGIVAIVSALALVAIVHNDR